MTAPDKSEIESAIHAAMTEAHEHGATTADIEQLIRQLKRIADIENEFTDMEIPN